jgi:hypothetical protein
MSFNRSISSNSSKNSKITKNFIAINKAKVRSENKSYERKAKRKDLVSFLTGTRKKRDSSPLSQTTS